MSDALAATELVLAREQHLSQLDGLAAAAAHELGTPLATITVVIREIERALEANSPHADDVKLLREQAQRCREILAKITELPAGDPFDRMPLSALIEEAVAPHRNFGVSIVVNTPPSRIGEPAGARHPGIRYGLGNLIENAVDSTTGMATARANIPNADELLWPGTLVSVQITLRTEDSIVVPTAAVQVSQQGNFVFVVKDNVATVTPVKVARLLGAETVIESGVDDGDVVVTDGHLLLTNGSRVTVRERKAGA